MSQALLRTYIPDDRNISTGRIKNGNSFGKLCKIPVYFKSKRDLFKIDLTFLFLCVFVFVNFNVAVISYFTFFQKGGNLF